ncbi:hypothetical protein LCGC14_0357870 [marine sediment metagenome]|uniref:Uncharacterized protein n=1 Tax=marine sediment metagenome TaxID=412755 RepID=A0A0F9TRS9_9ZZZZ
MNFAAVRAAPGNYIQLQVVVTDIQHRQGDFGAWASGKAQDGHGVIEDVSFAVAGKDRQGQPRVFPTALAVNHRINCAGKFDAKTNKMRIYFDSLVLGEAPAPKSYPPAGQPAQPTPPPQQATPPPRQPANAAPPARDATGVSIERQVCVKTVGVQAAASAEAEHPLTLREAAAWLTFYAHWIETGQFVFTESATLATQPSGPNPAYNPDGQEGDEDLPF